MRRSWDATSITWGSSRSRWINPRRRADRAWQSAVKHEDGRRHRQHGCDGNALLLAGAQVVETRSALSLIWTAFRAAATRSRTAAGRNP